MYVYLYEENGKYYEELFDLCGIGIGKYEIPKEEYTRRKNEANG